MMPELEKSELRPAVAATAARAPSRPRRDHERCRCCVSERPPPRRACTRGRSPLAAGVQIPTVARLRASRRRATTASVRARRGARWRSRPAMLGGAALVVARARGGVLARSDDEPHAAAATQRVGGRPRCRGAAAAPKMPPAPYGRSATSRPTCRSSRSTRSPWRDAERRRRKGGNGRLVDRGEPGLRARCRSTGSARGTTPLGDLELPAGAHRIDCAAAERASPRR